MVCKVHSTDKVLTECIVGLFLAKYESCFKQLTHVTRHHLSLALKFKSLWSCAASSVVDGAQGRPITHRI